MTALKNTTIAPMHTQRSNNYLIHTMSGPRLLDGETPEQKAAREAAAATAAAEAEAKRVADAAAKEAADAAAKAAADALKKQLEGLSDSEAKLLKENMAAKAKLKETNDALAAAQAQLAAFSGIDPVKAKELQDALAKAEADKAAANEEALKKAGNWDALKANMAEAHKKETEGLNTKLTETSGALNQAQKTIEDLTVGSSFTQSDFVTKQTVLTPAIARQVYGSYFDVQNGKVVGFNKPRGDAGRAPLVNSLGEPVPFEDAIKTIVNAQSDKEKILRSNLGNGTGTTTTNFRAGQRTENNQDQGPRGMSRIRAGLNAGALSKKTT